MENLYDMTKEVMMDTGLDRIYLTVKPPQILNVDLFIPDLVELEDKVIYETYGFVPIHSVKVDYSESYNEFVYNLESTGMIDMLDVGGTIIFLSPREVGRIVHCYPESWNDYRETVSNYCFDMNYNLNLYEELYSYIECGYLNEEKMIAMQDVPTYLTSRSYDGSRNMALALIEKITYDSILYHT